MFNHIFIVMSLALTFCLGAITRVYFSNCKNQGWSCVNNVPNDIVFSCRDANQHDIIAHIKDFYTGLITNVTIHQCNSVKIYLDCPQLLVSSRLQHFAVKDTTTLEFATLTEYTSKQTPATFTIDNVRDIVSIPKGTFKSPSNGLERKCFGNTPTLQAIVIRDSKINTIEFYAIHNVTGIKRIQFHNVTIANLMDHAINAVMDSASSQFTMSSSIIESMQMSAINVHTSKFFFQSNIVDTIHSHSLNVTSNSIEFTNNTIQEVKENGLFFSAGAINMSCNTFKKICSGAMLNSKCVRRRTLIKYFHLTNNTIVNVEPSSLHFDLNSCKSLRTPVSVQHNRMDCRCQHISWLTDGTTASHTDLNEMILNKENNNTCYPAPCSLPVQVVRILQSNSMCHLNLAPQVMCYVYYDQYVNKRAGALLGNDIDGDTSSNGDDSAATEATAAFYLIRQAPQSRGGGAAVASIDKDAILKDNRLNMTNRTTINMVFDTSKDFVETLRHTSSSRRQSGVSAVSATPQRREYVQPKCSGAACSSSVADNRQKALDFYKYLYAQLHTDKT